MPRWSAGSVLVYSGSVIHAGGENRPARIGSASTSPIAWGGCGRRRTSTFPARRHIARTLDPKLQALLGYAMGSYALGYFSPPLPPGEGPEGVPPQFALGEKVQPGWDDGLYEQVTERLKKKMDAA